MRSPKTLHGRLALWYAAVLTATLLVFSAVIYVYIAEDDETDQCVPAHICTLIDPPEHVGRRLGVALGVALPGAIAIAVVGGLWVTRKNLRSLEEIARVAGELGGQSLDRRVAIEPTAPAELASLGDALNQMLARIDRSVLGMRRFTADASHELRTPLAALRGNLEVTLRRSRSPDELRETCESALEEVTRLSELVELLLTLARSDAGELPLQPRSVDIIELVDRVVAPYEAVAHDRGLRLERVHSGPIVVETDPTWLERAIVNLVDNACKFTLTGAVRVETLTRNAGACIVVSDSGPGLSDDQAARIFERFYRSTSARSTPGFGLGLALASDVVRALGGTLSVSKSSLGGAAFTIELPQIRV